MINRYTFLLLGGDKVILENINRIVEVDVHKSPSMLHLFDDTRSLSFTIFMDKVMYLRKEKIS